MTTLQIPPKNNKIVLFQTKDGEFSVDVKLNDETVWLTQKQLSDLFEVDRTVITKHLSNIFKTAELSENSVCAKFAHTAKDGKKYKTNYYNLDAVISVGYRVNSTRATQFRIWAKTYLKIIL